MTAKQAIKARCRDCLAGARECTFMDCALKGLAKSKQGTNRWTAIRKYCHWCMNGNSVNQCASPDCGIYQFRANCESNLKVLFLPLKPLIDYNGGNSKSKRVISYGKGFPASVNAVITAPEGNQNKEGQPA